MLSRLCSRNWVSLHGGGSHCGLQYQWFSTKRCTSSYNDFTVSYLVNSCGLSPKAAVKASDKVNLQPSSLARPDSVLAVLREHEFSDTQISTLVRRDPRFLLADAKRTLLPKLEFLFSKGMSRLDVAKIVTYNSFLLSRSVENCFVPCYTFLKSVVVCDAKVVCIWKRNAYIFGQILYKNVIPNLEFVRELGMSQSRVPSMEALSRKETTWKRCQEAYRSWGWSDDDILSAFKVCPLCMTKSEKKIMETMDFLVSKMGWESGKIVKIPEYDVRGGLYQCDAANLFSETCHESYQSKGLIEEEKLSLATVITNPEEYFLSRFVTRYVDQVPQLSNIYQGKMDVQDV
uniref:uncharacterized protein LOC101312594 n=1 Tax=Fragaria vesca subsp. vesca TaxID=101020 RepID=UPI0005CA19D3|nr:PREDICTED: uncharacterized protein LOC101312594 [Fragaria vesca subsp. vesca]